MTHEINALGQPVGARLDGWAPPPHPAREPLEGRFCRLEPIELHHAAALYAANRLDADRRNWTYLPYGPFETFQEYATWVQDMSSRNDPQLFAILDTDRKPVGVAGFLNIVRIDRSWASELLSAAPTSSRGD